MLEPNNSSLSVRKQSKLLGICRSSIYYHSVLSDDSLLANSIREIYLESDCRYGYRKITASLAANGTEINHKKVLKVMQEMGIQGLYPKRTVNISEKDKIAEIYPYLLTELNINRANQVWATDITYISIEGKFWYFIAIIDLYSRYIIASELSPFLEAGFCVYTLQRCLKNSKPEIFNSDQGSQFTSNNFINELLLAGVKISMDHKGRCFDNIIVERLWRTLKQEAIYYYKPTTIKELEVVLANFVDWYNNKRIHQALNYKTPKEVYNE